MRQLQLARAINPLWPLCWRSSRLIMAELQVAVVVVSGIDYRWRLSLCVCLSVLSVAATAVLLSDEVMDQMADWKSRQERGDWMSQRKLSLLQCSGQQQRTVFVESFVMVVVWREHISKQQKLQYHGGTKWIMCHAAAAVQWKTVISAVLSFQSYFARKTVTAEFEIAKCGVMPPV